MRTEGILRISGTQVNIEQLRRQIDKGQTIDFKTCAIHDLAGLLKLFFRLMPNPLVPVSLFERAMDIIGKLGDNPEELLKQVLLLMADLPEGNRKLLLYILHFLSQIVKHCEYNKMKSNNLAIVFAPNLIRSRDEEKIDLTAITRANTLVMAMIDNYSSIQEHFKV